MNYNKLDKDLSFKDTSTDVELEDYAMRFGHGGNFLPNRILHHHALTHLDVILYLELRYLSGKRYDKANPLKGRCLQIHLTDLAEEVKLTRQTVRKCLDRLDKYNIVHLDTSGRPWIIFLNHQKVWEL